jgi:hypothetical protein
MLQNLDYGYTVIVEPGYQTTGKQNSVDRYDEYQAYTSFLDWQSYLMDTSNDANLTYDQICKM